MSVAIKDGKLVCPGCGRKMETLDAFHVRDCSSKQATLEASS
jgi:uncharacterized Zn finger protein (UPF0148 family)